VLQEDKEKRLKKEKITTSEIRSCTNYQMANGDLATRSQPTTRVFQLFILKIL